MIQNLNALTILISVTGYTIYSIIKNLTSKKAKGSRCECEGCSCKESAR